MFSKIKKGILIKNTLKNHFNEFLSRFPTSLIKNCSLISPCHSLECQALAIFYIQRRAERRVGYRDSSAHEITKVRSRFPTLSRVSRLAFLSLYIFFTLICILHLNVKELAVSIIYFLLFFNYFYLFFIK